MGALWVLGWSSTYWRNPESVCRQKRSVCVCFTVCLYSVCVWSDNESYRREICTVPSLYRPSTDGLCVSLCVKCNTHNLLYCHMHNNVQQCDSSRMNRSHFRRETSTYSTTSMPVYLLRKRQSYTFRYTTGKLVLYNKTIT